MEGGRKEKRGHTCNKGELDRKSVRKEEREREREREREGERENRRRNHIY